MRWHYSSTTYVPIISIFRIASSFKTGNNFLTPYYPQRSLLIKPEKSSISSSFHPNLAARAITGSNFQTTLKMSSSVDTQKIKKKILVPIADGSEEIETTCIQDTLVRFGGDVTLASVKNGGDLVCNMSRGIKILADKTIDDASKEEWDCIVLPGGMPGASTLRDCDALVTLLKKQNDEGKLYAAICASPAVALAPHGLAKQGSTCYPLPAFRGEIDSANDDDVVIQENLVTSQGPGTSLKFALQIGEQLYGKDKADKIAEEMLVDR